MLPHVFGAGQQARASKIPLQGRSSGVDRRRGCAQGTWLDRPCGALTSARSVVIIPDRAIAYLVRQPVEWQPW
jgi:hypothetical protein